MIFGKFHSQNKPLNNGTIVKVYNKDYFINWLANKYMMHKKKDNILRNDVFFFEKVKMYRLDYQYEKDGDAIMIDPNENREYNYYEKEFMNKNLSVLIEEIKNEFKLKENEIVIHLFNINF